MTDERVSPLAPADEPVLWMGHASQWVHFRLYVFCLLLAAAAVAGIPFTQGWSAVGLVIPFFLWPIRCWATRTTVYELTTQRLKIRRGIFSRRLDELELYRVKDYYADTKFSLHS